MQKITIVLLLLTYNSICFGQLNKQLCKATEEVIFAFQLKNKKWVAVCKEKKDNYIVYRFGTSPKLNWNILQFWMVHHGKNFLLKGI
jgi:hypothetical protein